MSAVLSSRHCCGGGASPRHHVPRTVSTQPQGSQGASFKCKEKGSTGSAGAGEASGNERRLPLPFRAFQPGKPSVMFGDRSLNLHLQVQLFLGSIHLLLVWILPALGAMPKSLLVTQPQPPYLLQIASMHVDI